MDTTATITYRDQSDLGCSDEPDRFEPTITDNPPPPIAHKYPRSIQLSDYTPGAVNTCPFASTTLMENLLTGKFLLAGQTCKRWNCPPCAREKIRDLATWTKLAAPNKLLTLTVDPALHDNPELAWLSTSPKVPELIRALRKRFGPVEYLRVVEVTQKNWPHYHMMVRSDFLPQPVIKKLWDQLTGAKIVDIRVVNQFFNSFQYLVKYLTKLHRLEWTDRHVTYSRKFFPCSITRTTDPTEWKVLQHVSEKPLTYLEENYYGRPLVQTGPLSFELPDCPKYWLPPEPKPDTPKPIVQQFLPDPTSPGLSF